MNNKQMSASYYLSRTEILKDLKKYKNILEKICLKGIENAKDERIARIACSIIASDYYYEDNMMNNKTGDYKSLINPPD